MEALKKYDCWEGKLTRLVIIITGKGPEKEYYEKVIS